MIVYVIMVIISYLFLYLSKKDIKVWQKKMLIFLSFLSLFIVSAFRFNVGTDFKNYVEWFSNATVSYLKPVNFGFNLLILFIKIFTNNNQVFFFVTSLIILILVYKSILEQQKDYDISLYLFVTLAFYFNSFNAVRQWISIAIIMYGLKYIYNRQFFQYAICVLLSSLFHITSIVNILLYFIFNLKIKNYVRIIVVALAFLVFKVFDITKIMLIVMEKFLPTYYYKYVVSGFNIYSGKGSFFPIILCCGMFIFYLIFKNQILKRLKDEEKEYNYKINIAAFLCIAAFMNSVNNIFSRFALYYIPYIILLLPDTLKVWDRRTKNILKVLLLVCTLLFMIINTSIKNSNGVLPYNFSFFS